MEEETEAPRGTVTFRVTQSVGSECGQAPKACSSLHSTLGEPGSQLPAARMGTGRQGGTAPWSSLRTGEMGWVGLGVG